MRFVVPVVVTGLLAAAVALPVFRFPRLNTLSSLDTRCSLLDCARYADLVSAEDALALGSSESGTARAVLECRGRLGRSAPLAYGVPEILVLAGICAASLTLAASGLGRWSWAIAVALAGGTVWRWFAVERAIEALRAPMSAEANPSHMWVHPWLWYLLVAAIGLLLLESLRSRLAQSKGDK